MRILVVHQRNPWRTAADEAVDREVALLRGAGVEVELWEKEVTPKKGILSALTSGLSWNEQAKRELSAKIAEIKPRLVHVHNFAEAFSPSLFDACEAAGIPAVLTLHDFQIFCANGRLLRDGKSCELCLGKSTFSALRYACRGGSRVETLACTKMIDRHVKEDTWNRKVHAFITDSNFGAVRLATAGLRKEKIHVKSTYAIPPTAEAVRASDLYALYVGELTEGKGILSLLDAWTGLETPLWVVGDGPLRAEVEACKSVQIKVLGPMPAASLARIMGKAEFLVVPSDGYDGIPPCLIDAFAFALPVVAARTGALAEVVKHERNGLLFEPGNADNLRSLVKKLHKEIKLIDRLIEGSRLEFTDRYQPKKNLQTLLEIYQAAFKAKKENAG